MAEHVWYCKIGGEIPDEVWEIGGEYAANDQSMRPIVEEAYEQRFGVEPEFVFSGWGQTLTESERAAAENRPPNHDMQIAWIARGLNLAYFKAMREIYRSQGKEYSLSDDSFDEGFKLLHDGRTAPHWEALTEAVRQVVGNGQIALP